MPLPTMTVLDSAGATRTANLPNSGRQAAADSQAVVLATEDLAAVGATNSAAAADETVTTGLNGVLKGIFAVMRARWPVLVNSRVPVDGSGVTQPVSGPLTNTELRASAVPVTGPLTDTQLRATAVPVSGTVGLSVGSAATRQFAQISDGTNSPAVKASASGPVLVTDPSLVVGMSPNSLSPALVVDITATALTTTTTSAGFVPSGGMSYQPQIAVSAVSGTSPTLDLSIEESDDGGTNWFRVYDFPRITAVGIYRSPKLPLTGNQVRYVQTVGGTTPSFTRSIRRMQCFDAAPPMRQIIDRTLNGSQAANATTGTLLNAQVVRNLQLVISAGAIATTAPALQLQGSDDGGVTWYNLGTPLTAVASSTVQQTVNNVHAGQTRAIVTTAGVGATLNHVTIKGF